MKKPYSIIIAEEHRIFREGLRSLFSSNPDFEIAGEAGDGMDAIRCAEKLIPDIVLIDLFMPRMDGLEAITEIKNRCPNIKILVLTDRKADEYIFESLNAGADGYILKDATYTELKLAMESVLDGNPYLSPGISRKLIAGYLEGMKKPESSYDNLTPRERQVMKLIAEGNKNKEIAKYLCISIKTVEKHRSNLMKKMDLHNASEITAFAMERSLVGNKD